MDHKRPPSKELGEQNSVHLPVNANDELTMEALAHATLIPWDKVWTDTTSGKQTSNEECLQNVINNIKKQGNIIRDQIRSLPPHPPLSSHFKQPSFDQIHAQNDAMIKYLETPFDPAKGKPVKQHVLSPYDPALSTTDVEHPATQDLQKLCELEAFDVYFQRALQKREGYLPPQVALGMADSTQPSNQIPPSTSVNPDIVNQASAGAEAEKCTGLGAAGINRSDPSIPTGPKGGAQASPERRGSSVLPSTSPYSPYYGRGIDTPDSRRGTTSTGAIPAEVEPPQAPALQGGSYDRSRDPRRRGR